MAIYFSDVETMEIMIRMKETSIVFGKRDFVVGSDDLILKNYVTKLREKEYKRTKWTKSSPQLRHRRPLVDYLWQICEAEGLSNQTAYLSIYLLDRFMDTHNIILPQLPVIAIVCIVISGKLLEINREIPRYRDLCAYLHGTPRTVFMKCLIELEIYLLKQFDYDVLIPTEMGFLEVYLLYACDRMQQILQLNTIEVNNNNCGDDNMPNANLLLKESVVDENNNEIKYDEREESALDSQQNYGPPVMSDTERLNSIHEAAFTILQILTRATVSTTCSPSLIAAAILMAARREYQLNYWTESLQNLTSYNVTEIQTCLTDYVEPIVANKGLSEPFLPPKFLANLCQIC